jgi:hypothetical protein
VISIAKTRLVPCHATRTGIRRPLLMTFLAFGLFLIVGQRGYRVAQRGPPSVRLVHASHDTPPINATLDGQVLAGTLSYGAVSASISFPGGSARLRIVGAEEPSKVVLDTPVELPLDGPATIVLAGLIAGTPSLNALVLSDYLGQTAQDRSRLRFVNVAAGSDPISVHYGSGMTLFESVGYGAMADAVLDPGPLHLRAVTSGPGAAVLVETMLQAVPGRS